MMVDDSRPQRAHRSMPRRLMGEDGQLPGPSGSGPCLSVRGARTSLGGDCTAIKPTIPDASLPEEHGPANRGKPRALASKQRQIVGRSAGRGEMPATHSEMGADRRVPSLESA